MELFGGWGGAYMVTKCKRVATKMAARDQWRRGRGVSMAVSRNGGRSNLSDWHASQWKDNWSVFCGPPDC